MTLLELLEPKKIQNKKKKRTHSSSSVRVCSSKGVVIAPVGAIANYRSIRFGAFQRFVDAVERERKLGEEKEGLEQMYQARSKASPAVGRAILLTPSAPAVPDVAITTGNGLHFFESLNKFFCFVEISWVAREVHSKTIIWKKVII